MRESMYNLWKIKCVLTICEQTIYYKNVIRVPNHQYVNQMTPKGKKKSTSRFIHDDLPQSDSKKQKGRWNINLISPSESYWPQ